MTWRWNTLSGDGSGLRDLETLALDDSDREGKCVSDQPSGEFLLYETEDGKTRVESCCGQRSFGCDEGALRSIENSSSYRVD